MADKLAINASNKSTDEISLELIKVVRPDLFTKIHRRLLWEEQLKNSPTIEVDPRKIKQGPALHKELPVELIGRIRLIRAALWGTHTHSMDVWVDGFLRDRHPEKEVAWWEHVSSCYLEFIKSRKLSKDQIDTAFWLIFLICNGEDPSKFDEYENQLGAENLKLLCKLPLYRYPILDVKEEFPEERESPREGASMWIKAKKIDDFDIRPDEQG